MTNEEKYKTAEALTVGGMVETSRKSEMSKNVSKNGADFGQLGNAAALREAVEGAKEKALYISRHYTTPNSLTGNILELLAYLNAALAAPPRNCDVGTAEEQAERFKEYCTSNWDCMKDCPIGKMVCDKDSPGEYCQSAWDQMPYEEGGSDGSKQR